MHSITGSSSRRHAVTESLSSRLPEKVMRMAYRQSASLTIGSGLVVRTPVRATASAARRQSGDAGIARWDNEGGAMPSERVPADAVFSSPARNRPASVPGARRKQPHDTSAGCRVRAQADLLASPSADTEHGRQRLAHSAASWAMRADMLERLEAGWQSRAAAKSIPQP